jgi:DNA-binding transcriptional MerR regulator
MNTVIPETYRIGELSKRADKTVRTIHFYEELGLLQPTERSPGGFRMYTDHALDRIHWIERLQDLDFSLTDIKAFLEDFQAQDTGPSSMETLRHFYTEKLNKTRTAIASLQSLEIELASSLTYLAACQSCSITEAVQACASCCDEQHSDSEAPRMVAAIATST